MLQQIFRCGKTSKSEKKRLEIPGIVLTSGDLKRAVVFTRKTELFQLGESNPVCEDLERARVLFSSSRRYDKYAIYTMHDALEAPR